MDVTGGYEKNKPYIGAIGGQIFQIGLALMGIDAVIQNESIHSERNASQHHPAASA